MYSYPKCIVYDKLLKPRQSFRITVYIYIYIYIYIERERERESWSDIRVAGCNTDITPTQPHRNSNTHRNKNNTTNVVIQQNSRSLLMMEILMSETF